MPDRDILMTGSQGGKLFAAILFGLGIAFLAGILPATAQDFSPGNISKSYPYKDLPGVTDQDKKKQPAEKAPDCTRELRLRGLGRLDRFDRFDRDAPISVYSCEQNGLIIESEHAPIPNTWNPMDLR